MKAILLRDPSEAQYGKRNLTGIFAVKRRSRSNPLVNANASAEGLQIGEALRLIPWRYIWSTLSMARGRGASGIVDTFFEILSEESLFDDRGA